MRISHSESPRFNDRVYLSWSAAEVLVEGYRIPGHRLGSIIASAELQESIAVVCDCMQVRPFSIPLPHCAKGVGVKQLTSDTDLCAQTPSISPRFRPLQTPARPLGIFSSTIQPPLAIRRDHRKSEGMVCSFQGWILRLRPISRPVPFPTIRPRTEGRRDGRVRSHCAFLGRTFGCDFSAG